MIKEEQLIRIKVIFGHLKRHISPALNNDYYQKWVKTNKKQKFSSYVIEQHLLMVYKELESEKE